MFNSIFNINFFVCSSELDFEKKVVEKVNINLSQIVAEEGRNVTQETTTKVCS